MNKKKKQLPFFTRMLHPSVETAAVVATVISVAALVISALSYRLSSEQVLEQQKLVVAEKLTEIKLLVLEEKEALDEGMRNLRDLDPPPMDLDELEKLYRSMRSFYDKLEIHYLSLILSGDMLAAERLRGTLLLSSKNVTGGLKLSEKLISEMDPGFWTAV